MLRVMHADVESCFRLWLFVLLFEEIYADHRSEDVST